MAFYIGKDKFIPVKKCVVGESYIIVPLQQDCALKKGQFVGKKDDDAIFTNISVVNTTDATYNGRRSFSLYDWEFYRLA